MAINTGDKAPDFTLVTKTADGPQLVKLSDLVGKSNIVLLFVPMAVTGVAVVRGRGEADDIGTAAVVLPRPQP